MGRKISQEALRKHKEESLKTLETYIDSLTMLSKKSPTSKVGDELRPS